MSQSPSDVGREEMGTPNLSKSDRHKLLAAKHRRVALDILNERSSPVDLQELAAAIARHEANGDAVDEQTIERVAIALHHKHLPLMGEFGVIDYDVATTVVES